MRPIATYAQSLDDLISGKRTVPRRIVAMPVCIKAAHGDFWAVVRDLSPDGALLELPESALADLVDGPLDAARQFAVMERHFHESFDLRFQDVPVVVEARLVRVSLTTDGSGRIGLGCRFEHPLTEKQQHALDVDEEHAEGADEAAWSAALSGLEIRFLERPGRPVTAMLLDEFSVVRGPADMGRVTHIGARALVVRLEGVDWAKATRRFSETRVNVRLVRGKNQLLAASAECITVRYADGRRPGTDLLLKLRHRLPRLVRRSFKRA